MTTVPSGAPAWVRSNDYTSYGGDPNKKNFASRGVVNPKTDVGAEAFSRLASDVAAASRTAEFCVMQVLCESVGLDPTVESCQMMTGVAASAYTGTAPLPGFPTVERYGNGAVTITFENSYDDEYGVAGAFTMNSPTATLIGNTPGVANPEILGPNVVRVRCVDLTGAAITGARFSLVIGSGG